MSNQNFLLIPKKVPSNTIENMLTIVLYQHDFNPQNINYKSLKKK